MNRIKGPSTGLTPRLGFPARGLCWGRRSLGRLPRLPTFRFGLVGTNAAELGGATGALCRTWRTHRYPKLAQSPDVVANDAILLVFIKFRHPSFLVGFTRSQDMVD